MDTVDFTKFCLLTGSKDNLSTKMDIEHHGKLYKIAICEAASEDASLKLIKARLNDVLDEMDLLISRAKDFGLIITYSKHNTNSEVVQPQPQQINKPIENTSNVGNAVMLDNIELSDLDGKKQTISIPKKIIDKNGTTEIQIVKTDNKVVLEQTAKYNSSEHSLRSGYGAETQTQTCTPCRGLGLIRMKSSTARKCNGCRGERTVKSQNGQTITCETCSGVGSTYFTEIQCKKCGGLGLLNN